MYFYCKCKPEKRKIFLSIKKNEENDAYIPERLEDKS